MHKRRKAVFSSSLYDHRFRFQIGNPIFVGTLYFLQQQHVVAAGNVIYVPESAYFFKYFLFSKIESLKILASVFRRSKLPDTIQIGRAHV